MSESISIVLIDGGDQVASGPAPRNVETGEGLVGPPSSPRVTAPPPTRDTPEPDGSPGKQRTVKGPDAGQSAANLMAMLTRGLGGSELVSGIQQMQRVFSDVVSNAANLAKGLSGPAPASAGPVVSPPELPSPAPSPTISPPPSRSTTISPAGGSVAPKISGPRPISVPGPAAGGATSGHMMAHLAKAIGPAGIAVGGFAAAIVGAGLAVKKFDSTLHAEAKRLEYVSGELSAAASMNQVRGELADIRRAERIGPDLARFENARGRLGDASAKVLDEIYAALAKVGAEVTPAILRTAAGVEVIAAMLNEWFLKLEAAQAILAADQKEQFRLGIEVAQAGLKKQEALNRFLRGKFGEEEEIVDPFTDSFLRQFGNPAPGLL